MTHSARRPAPARRDIDIAVGILVGLQGYSEREAFDELVRAMRRTGAGISSVSRSLIAVAGGRREVVPDAAGALELWGDALAARAQVASARAAVSTARAS